MDEHNTDLEARIARLEKRISRLESFFPGQAATPPVRPAPTVEARATAPKPPKESVPSEPTSDRALGRLIGWAGGIALITGIILLVGLAIERGWIGPAARFVLGMLAAALSTALSVYFSNPREGIQAFGKAFGRIEGGEYARTGTARTLFVVGLAGGYAASYAGLARWDLYGLPTLSALVGLVTGAHLLIGHISKDGLRAGSAIAAAFFVPVYAEELTDIGIDPWPALILFSAAAFLGVVWTARSKAMPWLLGTVGAAALVSAVGDLDAGGERTVGVLLYATAAVLTMAVIGSRDAEAEIDDAAAAGWLALVAGLVVNGWAFEDPSVAIEVTVVGALVGGAVAAHRYEWRRVADGLTAAAVVLSLLATHDLFDQNIVSVATVAALVLVGAIWWAGFARLDLTAWVTYASGLLMAVIAIPLLSFPIFDNRGEVVGSGGIVLAGLVLASLIDTVRMGRWVLGASAAAVWVAWWAAVSWYTFEPDAITTAGWFASAIIAMTAGRRVAGVRAAGLTLAGISYLKLFVYDLSAVDPAIRIVLFLVVGAALVAFAYRFTRVERESVGES